MATNPEFADFVETRSPAPGLELPFVHSTRCEFFPHLCSAGFLSPRDCPVFNEPLLYFFYGRPAYRSRIGSKPDPDLTLFPVCFVFKSGVFDTTIKRAFPFDTGAANGGMFAPHVTAASVSEFTINPSIQSIQRAVGAFFDTNGNYYTGVPGSLTSGSPTGLNTVDCYCRLISEPGEKDYDDRRFTMEVQTTQSVILRDNLSAVVLPSPFLDMAGVMETIVKEWRTQPIRYSHHHGTAPNEYVRTIMEKVENHLRGVQLP